MSLPSTENVTSATGNLADILREQARRRPDQPAIIDTHRGHERVTTFAELERRVARRRRCCGMRGCVPAIPCWRCNRCPPNSTSR